MFLTPDNRIYKQIDGVAMGSSLGPTFANFFMGYLKESTIADITIMYYYIRKTKCMERKARWENIKRNVKCVEPNLVIKNNNLSKQNYKEFNNNY